MRVIAPVPKQFEDSNGVPYANGKVTVYLHNSTSLARIYKEAEGGTLAPNPTILDSHGAWNAFVNGDVAYDYVVQDEHDNVIFSYSNVKAYGGSGGGGGVSASVLMATAETIEGNDSALSQSFSFSESEKIGEDIYIQEGSVKCNAGVYHVDFSISIAINQTTPPRPWVENVSIDYGVGYAYINLDRSNMDPTASDSVDVGYDIVVDTDETTLPVTLIGLGTNCYATMQHFNVHKVAEVEQ